MPSNLRLRESSDRVRRRVWQRSLALGTLLFATGCPQLLEDHFVARDSIRFPPDASPGGACGGGAVCEEGGAAGTEGAGRGGAGGRASSSGAGGTSSNTGGAGGSSGAGGSGNGGSAGSDGNAGSGGGSAGAAGAGPLAELRECPFAEPEPLAGIEFASGSEWGASLTPDGLTLYFAHGQSTGDLYRATRSDRGVSFSTPVALTNLNTHDDEGTPFISADGLRLYYHSTRPGGLGGKDLYVSTRVSLAEEFPSGQLLANVNSPEFDHLPRLSRDELTLWFTSTRPGGSGNADVWTATRASIDAPFGDPTPLEAVNGSSGDESGALTQDGLMLLFDTTRNGAGNSDIFVARRPSAGEAFPSPTALDAVNSERNEYNVFLTSDELELFFSSNRTAGTTHHLFRAVRRCD